MSPGNRFEHLLKTAEIANILRVDPATVARWEKAGKLPGSFRTPGGRIRCPESNVLALAGLLAAEAGPDLAVAAAEGDPE